MRSPKTEHHTGHARRVIPLFPELHDYLLEACSTAAEGDVNLIRRARGPKVNLRTQLLRILDQAGVEPWPKLFHNLRASRQTELTEIYPEHVVNTWLGNSLSVARKNYLQVTDQHYAAAAGIRDGAQVVAQGVDEAPHGSVQDLEVPVTAQKQPFAAVCDSSKKNTWPARTRT